jgi:4-aminobutyrate aminotransferase-like enzyme
MTNAETAPALLDRRSRILGPAYRLFYDRPLQLARGEGVWLYDESGKPYLDAYNNVACVGHCHPRVVEAIARQSATLNTHTRYLHPLILDYAEALIATFPAELSQITFTCTGSEANDLAVRIARHVTGGTGMIVTANAYHGVTATLAECSPSLGANLPLGAHVRTVPAPDSAPGAAERFAAAVQSAIDDLIRHGIKPALLLADTIFSSDGIFADPPGFLAPAIAAIHRAGALFVADEVQPGFARTGDAMWGFLRHDILPDLVSLGKPMGNGYPLAGLVSRPEIIADFGKTVRYFNTFGGNPVAAAAGLAVLQTLGGENLMTNARTTGAYLRAGLARLAKSHALISDIRGAGLFIGVELTTGDTPATAETARIVNTMRERGVLLSSSGPHANILKIRPPLVFAPEHADQLLQTLDAALRAL